ncbi:hypothetical protein ACFLVK_00450 [Chloroflexota bacterium]
MEKVLIVDLDSCNGCRICELVCSMHKEGEYNPKKSCIQVLSNKETETNIPVLDMNCDFCGLCLKWCPSKALSIVNLEEAMAAAKGTKLGKLPAVRVSRA